jgi:hypothetical protein
LFKLKVARHVLLPATSFIINYEDSDFLLLLSCHHYVRELLLLILNQAHLANNAAVSVSLVPGHPLNGFIWLLREDSDFLNNLTAHTVKDVKETFCVGKVEDGSTQKYLVGASHMVEPCKRSEIVILGMVAVHYFIIRIDLKQGMRCQQV